MKYVGRQIVCVLLYTLATLGCAPGRMQIPHTSAGSPLDSLAPLIFRIEMHENRTERFIDVSHGYGEHLGEREVAGFIAETLASELKRSGHRVQGERATEDVDIVIVGRVEEAAVRLNQTTSTRAGFVTVNLSVERTADSNRILSRTYRGSHYDDKMTQTRQIIPDVFNEALLNLIEEFTIDPDLINGLKQVAQSR